MTDVEQFLKSNQIEYVLHEHPAVYTCEEAKRYRGDIPGLASKNLLLRNQDSSRHFLMILPAKKRLDLKKLGNIVGIKKITFATREALQEKLGLETGAVSPFGLLNDEKNEIELYIDKEIYDAEIVSFHPNINTASVELSRDMFHKFLQAINHKANVIEL